MVYSIIDMEKQKQDDLHDKIVECYKGLYPDIKDYIVDGFIDGVNKEESILIAVSDCGYVIPLECWKEIQEVIDNAIKPLLVTLKSEALKKEDIKDLHKQYHKIKDPAEQRKCLHKFMQKNKSEWNIDDRRKNIKTEIEKIFKKYNITDKRAMEAIFYNIGQDKQKCNNISWTETKGIIDEIVKGKLVTSDDYKTINSNIAQIMLFHNFMFLNDEIHQIAIKNQLNGTKPRLKAEQLVNKTNISVEKVKKYDIIYIKDCSATLNSKSGTHDKIGIVINKEKKQDGKYRVDCLFLNSQRYNTHDVLVNNSDLHISKIVLPNGATLESNFVYDKGSSYISLNSYELKGNDYENISVCGHLMPANQSHKQLISNITTAIDKKMTENNIMKGSIDLKDLKDKLCDFAVESSHTINEIDDDIESVKKKKKKHRHKNKKKKNGNDNNNIQEEDQKEENSEAKNEINDGNQLDDVMEKENNNNIPTLTSKNMVGNQTLAKK